MPQDAGPNIAKGLFAIHKVISRALEMSIERGRVYWLEGYPDPALREGYLMYAATLASAVHAHHLTEDELMFPYFRGLLPDVPYSVLTAHHNAITGLLERMDNDGEGTATLAGLEVLVPALERLREIWYPHIGIEETQFAPPVVGPMLPAEEHGRLLGQYGAHFRDHAGPPYLSVPFLLFNLPEEPRAVLAEGMPREVVQQLVPVVWKEKWAPMAPFLLT